MKIHYSSKKGFVILIFASVFSQSSLAAISYFSRANCAGINESLTWEATGVFTNKVFYVTSHHVASVSTNSSPHTLSDGGSNWRARAGDQGDLFDFYTCPPRAISWSVYGTHSYFDPDINQVVNLPSSSATDCNLSEW